MSASELNHVVEGPAGAPAIVFLGSLGSNLEMWEPQAEGLRGELRLVRVDLRGHGGSPVPPGPYAVADLGEDVVALLGRLGIERATICGVSLGGSIALWLGANRPERVEGLVVCFSSAHFDGPEAYLERAALVRAEGTAVVADAVVARWFTEAFAARRPEAVARMRGMIAATPPEGYAACCEAVAGVDLREQLGSIAAPTLVIAGGEDPATPPEHGKLVAAGVPGARFVEIPDAAHLGSFEHPGRVNGLIREHLGALAAGQEEGGA